MENGDTQERLNPTEVSYVDHFWVSYEQRAGIFITVFFFSDAG